MKSVARAASKLLMILGAITFLVGDRALEEIWKVNFFTGEFVGVGSGIAIMLLGAVLQYATKEPTTKSDST